MEEMKEVFQKLNVALEARLQQIEKKRGDIERIKSGWEEEYETIRVKMPDMPPEERLAIDAKLAWGREAASRELRELDHEVLEIMAMRTALRRDAGLADPEVEEVKRMVSNSHLHEDILLFQDQIAASTRCITNCVKCITDCIKCITSCINCVLISGCGKCSISSLKYGQPNV